MKSLVLNLKNYPESSGANAVQFAKAAAGAKAEGCEAIVCPPQLQLEGVCRAVAGTTIFSQHADAATPGKTTGAITLEALKQAGASGTLLNHSERKVSLQHAEFVCNKARELQMRVVACADSVEKGIELARFSPWAVAVEPPELIGTLRSVSNENPQIVTDAVKRVKAANPGVLVFVGAGVANANDCAKCIELGADGALVATAFVIAKDKTRFVQECLNAMA